LYNILKEKALQYYAKGLGNIRLPGLVSESVFLWGKIQIHIHRIKHGKLRISSLNPYYKKPLR